MSDSPDDKKAETGYWGWLKKYIAPFGSVLGAILLVYQFVQIWCGDQAIMTWLTAGAGAILILAGLIYIGFSKVTHQGRIQRTLAGTRIPTWTEPRFPGWRKPARWALGFCALAILCAGIFLIRHQQALANKTIILVTNIAGPEPQNYRVSDIIYFALDDEFAGNTDYKIIYLEDEIITEAEGSKTARRLGERYRADLVLWGWYGVTETDALVTLHVENLSAIEYLYLESTGDWVTQVAVSELDSFTLQQSFGEGLTSLAFFVQGLSYSSDGDFSSALTYFDRAIEQGVWADDLIGQSSIFFYRGTACLFLGQYEQAAIDFTQAISLDPQDAYAYNNRGITYALLGDYPSALADFTQAISLDPQNANAYCGRGITYADLEDYSSALADYTQAISLDPQLAIAYNSRGNTYYLLGDYPSALVDYTQAISLDPQDATNYYNRGLTYADLGDYPSALADYTQAISLDPQYADAYFNRGNTYYQLGDYPSALADYTQAISLDPQYADAYCGRGITYADLEDYSSALADYTQAISLDPQNAIAYYNRGNTYLDLEDYPSALADYTQAISLNPQFARAYYNRGDTYFDLEDYPSALADFTQAISLDPQPAPAYYNRGNTYYQLGDYPSALADFTQAISLDPQYAAAYANRGSLYLNLGQYEEAEADLQQAQALCSDDLELCQTVQEAIDDLPAP